MKSINILGATWTILFTDAKAYPALKTCDGFADSSVRLIVVDDMSYSDGEQDAKQDINGFKNQVLRHEIIHAFLSESGLEGNGNGVDHWEVNEEMIDWFAIQAPKIFKVFKELNII